MGIFDYKHSKKEAFKKIETSEIEEKKEIEEGLPDSLFVVPEETTSEKSLLVKGFKQIFNDKSIVLNPLFDSDLESSLGIFENFINSHFLDLEPYKKNLKNGTSKVSLRAFIDARDYLINEFGETPKDLLDVNLDINGNNVDYRNLTIKNNGKIYKSNEVIFDPTEPCDSSVKEIDFEKMSVTLDPGLIIPFSYLLGVTEELTNKKDPSSDSALSESNTELLLDPKNNAFFNELVTKNTKLKNKKIKKLDFSEKLTADELFKTVGIIDYENKLKSFVLNPLLHRDVNLDEGITVCNLKEVNFMYLLLLVILGGGKEGVFPVGSRNSQIVTSDNRGCSRVDVNTYHPLLWSNSRKQGVPISALQLLAPVVNLLKRVNIPSVEFMGFRVFRGICVLGNLHIGLVKFQGELSKKIRDAFKCEIKLTQPRINSDGFGFSLETKKTEFFKEKNPVNDFISLTNKKSATGEPMVDKDGSVLDSIITAMANGQIPLNYVAADEVEKPAVQESIYKSEDDAPNIDQVPYFIANFVYTDDSKKTGTVSFDDYTLIQKPKYKNVLLSEIVKTARYEVIPITNNEVTISLDGKQQKLKIPKSLTSKKRLTSAELRKLLVDGRKGPYFRRLVSQKAYVSVNDGYTFELSEEPKRVSLPVTNGKFYLKYNDGYHDLNEEVEIEIGYFVKFNTLYLISKTRKG